MVIVRSAFVNGGAIIPIRWSSDCRRAQQGLSRTFATLKQEPTSPSLKVKARSFRVRPKDAERFLEEKAYETTHSPKSELLRWAGEKLGGKYDNELNERGIAGKSLERVLFKAYYWPVWKFSCFAETRVENNTRSVKAIIDLPDNVIPGSHVSPLSLLTLGDDPFDAEYLKPYDPKSHLRYHGMPISAIPFSISPFDVMELARNSAPARVRLTTNDRTDFWVSPKNDIREMIAAAYPVYHPIYVAEYDFVLRDDLPVRRIALALDAYDPVPWDEFESGVAEPRIFMPNIYDNSWRNKNKGYWGNRDDNRTDLDDIGNSFFQGGLHEETLSISLNPPAEPRTPPMKKQDRRTIELAPPVSPLNAIKMHQSSIPWDDVRIQEYGSTDFLANRAWVYLNNDKFAADIALMRYKDDVVTKAIKTKNRNLVKEMEEDPLYKFLKHNAEQVTERWQRGKPDWLRKPGALGKRRIKPDPAGRFAR